VPPFLHRRRRRGSEVFFELLDLGTKIVDARGQCGWILFVYTPDFRESFLDVFLSIEEKTTSLLVHWGDRRLPAIGASIVATDFEMGLVVGERIPFPAAVEPAFAWLLCAIADMESPYVFLGTERTAVEAIARSRAIGFRCEAERRRRYTSDARFTWRIGLEKTIELGFRIADRALEVRAVH
jgi:hypothetical protein